MSAGLAPQPEHHVGETKNIGGVTYRLNEHHRWERDQDADGMGDAKEAGMGAPQPQGFDHATRHKTAVAALKTIEPKIGGLIRAFHESPEYQSGGETSRHDVAPQQAQSAYQWLKQNANKNAGGGIVKDFGNGRLGFSSAAGAFYVDAPDASGRQQIHYTTNTGPVSRAAKGQPNALPAADESGQAQPPAATQPHGGEHEPDTSSVPTGDEHRQLATPDTSASIAPPVDARPARQAADEARNIHALAVQAWESARQKGLSPKDNAKFRSNVAALNSIAAAKEKAADAMERQSAKTTKEAGKEIAGKKKATRTEEAKKIGAMPTRDELAEKGRAAVEAQQRKADEPLPLETQGGGDVPQVDEAKLHKWAAENNLFSQPSGGAVPEADPLTQQAVDLPHVGRRMFDSLKGLSEKTGIAHSDENRKLILKHLKSGDIRNPRELRNILHAAKRMHERGDLQESDTPHLKKAIKRKINRDAARKESWASIKKEQAKLYGMTPDEYESIANEVWRDKADMMRGRDAARQAIAKHTGINAADINRLENQGYDSGSKHDEIRGLDTIGREIASQYPELGWGRGYEDQDSGDDTDYAEKAWNLLREGPIKIPNKNSPEFLAEIEDYLNHHTRGDAYEPPEGESVPASATDEGESIPFSKQGRVTRYMKWLLRTEQQDRKFAGSDASSA